MPADGTKAATKTISARIIAANIKLVLDPSGKKVMEWDAKITKFVKGGDAALSAFTAVLNQSEPFSGYGLALKPTDLAEVEVVKDVLTAVIRWFQGAGYKVTI